MNAQEIRLAIMNGEFTHAELVSIQDMAAWKVRNTTTGLRIGDRVTINHPKCSGLFGHIVRKNQKTYTVEIENSYMTYRVSPNLLHAA